MAANAVGEASARAKEDLVRVQEALVATEEGRHKAEGEITCLEVERTSVLLELGATKDEVSSLHSQFSGGQVQGGHGGRVPEGSEGDFCLWVRV